MKHHRQSIPPEFEREFGIEILKSERVRMTILIGLFSLIFVIIFLLYFLMPGELAERYRHSSVRWISISVLIAVILYEIAGRWLLTRAVNGGRHPPPYWQYGNALLETSVPTLMLYLFSETTAPEEVLYAPPSYAYFAFILLSVLRLDMRLSLFTGIVSAAGYGCLVWWFRDHFSFSTTQMTANFIMHFVKILFYLLGGVAAGFVALQVRRRFLNSMRAVEERNRLFDVFGQHVSPAVMARLLDTDAGSASEERDVSLLFLDIRNFTRFAEERAAAEVVEYLNTVFSRLIDCVNRNNGIINKFLGDGFFAVFGAPLPDGRSVHNCLLAAREIAAEIDALNKDGVIPLTAVGIGLHVGPAITGNVGSSDRKEYTIIGDSVNLAARIEQMNKEFRSTILASDAVFHAVGGIPGAEALPPVTVKGRQQPVQLYRVL